MKTLAHETSRAEISRRLRTVRPDAERRWGRMSAHQMICHLADGFRMATGSKPVAKYGGRLPRTLVKWIALYGPVRWPAGVPTRPELDQRCAGTKPAAFDADLAELERLLEFFVTREADFAWASHPLFGTMTRNNWLRWGYLHVDHHLRQFGV